MKLLFPIVFVIAFVTFLPAMAVPSNNELLVCLDSLLINRNDLEKKRQYIVDDYRQKLSNARNVDERYRLNNMLYEIYSLYSIDSAMNYLERNFRIADTLGDSLRVADLKIKKSFPEESSADVSFPSS